jgi:hypothetical protein
METMLVSDCGLESLRSGPPIEFPIDTVIYDSPKFFKPSSYWNVVESNLFLKASIMNNCWRKELT